MVEMTSISVFQRFMWGLLGGAASIAAKIYGEGAMGIAAIVRSAEFAEVVGYFSVAGALLFLGAVIGSAVRSENNPIKLIAIAASAPALITTWSTGTGISGATVPTLQPITVSAATTSAVSPTSLMDYFIAPALAQSTTEESDNTLENNDDGEVGNGNNISLDGIRRGVGLFFGIEEKKYWVIVGSHSKISAAASQVEKINEEDPSLQAWIGEKVPPNEFYPVIVGPYSKLDDARILEQRAIRTNAVTEAYLSAGAKR